MEAGEHLAPRRGAHAAVSAVKLPPLGIKTERVEALRKTEEPLGLGLERKRRLCVARSRTAQTRRWSSDQLLRPLDPRENCTKRFEVKTRRLWLTNLAQMGR